MKNASKNRNPEPPGADINGSRVLEHIDRLTRLLRESTEGAQRPSPLEIQAALDRSSDILANHKFSPADPDGKKAGGAAEKRYLAVIAGFGMGESDTYRLVREGEVRYINYHGEYVELYELAGGDPLHREKAEKLGLKFLEKKKTTKP